MRQLCSVRIWNLITPQLRESSYVVCLREGKTKRAEIRSLGPGKTLKLTLKATRWHSDQREFTKRARCDAEAVRKPCQAETGSKDLKITRRVWSMLPSEMGKSWKMQGFFSTPTLTRLTDDRNIKNGKKETIRTEEYTRSTALPRVTFQQATLFLYVSPKWQKVSSL